MEQWRWDVLIRIPAEISPDHVAEAVEQVRRRKGLDARDVRLTPMEEGRSLQVMHVGPYDEVSRTYESLSEHMAANGLEMNGPAHEIYLSDPRRVAPDKLKTIVRLPVTESRA